MGDRHGCPVGPLGGDRDALFISPGVNVYLLYNVTRNGGPLFGGGPEYYGLFAADVEMTWQHRWTERCQGEFGFKLGAGVLNGSRPIPVPLVGVSTGWRF